MSQRCTRLSSIIRETRIAAPPLTYTRLSEKNLLRHTTGGNSSCFVKFLKMSPHMSCHLILKGGHISIHLGRTNNRAAAQNAAGSTPHFLGVLCISLKQDLSHQTGPKQDLQLSFPGAARGGATAAGPPFRQRYVAADTRPASVGLVSYQSAASFTKFQAEGACLLPTAARLAVFQAEGACLAPVSCCQAQKNPSRGGLPSTCQLLPGSQCSEQRGPASHLSAGARRPRWPG